MFDGAKEPDTLPEYLLWRSGFDTLAQAATRNRQLVLKTVALPETELRLVIAEARAQAARDVACKAQQSRRMESLQAAGASVKTINSEIQTIGLACRSEVLAAKNRPFQKLSDEGRTVPAKWMDDRRKGLTVFVLEQDLKFFKLPR